MPNLNTSSESERARANKILSAAINRALMEIHDQDVGVRVITIETTTEPLNPPGTSYNIRVQAQVTLVNKKDPQ